ncbi:MAG TPA: RNA 2',3'-cyclic phosphodiesterase [Candidatus Saccharimonadales bacterium]|nr:RNA 2',3'-cyclic phosphodiesterase [Candidatus Saccharimonadales bacterium]
MRLFVALEIPAETRTELAALSEQLRPLLPKHRWTPAASIHLTLKFIGEVSASSLDDVCRALADVKSRSTIAVRSATLGSFHRREKGGLLFAKIEQSAELAELAGQIDRQLQLAGVAGETRAFVPHLTLARCKNGELPDNIAEILANFSRREFANFHAGEFSLVESKLKPAGAEYTILQSFPFVAET